MDDPIHFQQLFLRTIVNIPITIAMIFFGTKLAILIGAYFGYPANQYDNSIHTLNKSTAAIYLFFSHLAALFLLTAVIKLEMWIAREFNDTWISGGSMVGGTLSVHHNSTSARRTLLTYGLTIVILTFAADKLTNRPSDISPLGFWFTVAVSMPYIIEQRQHPRVVFGSQWESDGPPRY